MQFSKRTKLSSVRKRWYNTQTVPKPANRKTSYNTQTEPKPVASQKKLVQYSNSAKTCHQSEKDGTILKQCQNLITARKRLCNSQKEQNCHQSEKDGTILKQCQNLLTEKHRTILKQSQNL